VSTGLESVSKSGKVVESVWRTSRRQLKRRGLTCSPLSEGLAPKRCVSTSAWKKRGLEEGFIRTGGGEWMRCGREERAVDTVLRVQEHEEEACDALDGPTWLFRFRSKQLLLRPPLWAQPPRVHPSLCRSFQRVKKVQSSYHP
jgi:hypothetical protein